MRKIFWNIVVIMFTLTFSVAIPVTKVNAAQLITGSQPVISNPDISQRLKQRARARTKATPSISNFRINNGAQFTSERLVVLNHMLSVTAGDYYRASESHNFAGVLWVSYTSNPNFNLSPGNGLKHVYFQVKNTASNRVSSVVHDSIMLQNPRIISMDINGGSSSTQNANVALGSTIDGVATEYRASDISGVFPGVQWKQYSSSSAITFTLSNYALGTKKVYFQVRNGTSISNIVSDSITFDANTEYTVSGRDAYDFARTHGFSFEASGDPQSALVACTYEIYAAELKMYTTAPPGAARCRFNLFNGKQLKAPWRIISVNLYTGSDWRWITHVTPESSNPAFAVHLDKPVGELLPADLRLESVRLLGPSGASWHEAFE